MLTSQFCKYTKISVDFIWIIVLAKFLKQIIYISLMEICLYERNPGVTQHTCWEYYIDGFQDCSNSSALAMEFL